MADLVITSSQTSFDHYNTTSNTQPFNIPAYDDGDLVVMCVKAWSNGAAKTITTWGTGNGETVTSLVNSYGEGTSDTCYISIGWFIGDGSYAGGDKNFVFSGSTRTVAAFIVVPAGEFDDAKPLSTAVGYGNASTGSNVTFGAFSANSDDGGGALLSFPTADVDPISASQPLGWTQLENRDGGRSAMSLNVRDTAVTASESISATTWTISSDAWAIYAFIIRTAAGYPEDLVFQSTPWIRITS